MAALLEKFSSDNNDNVLTLKSPVRKMLRARGGVIGERHKMEGRQDGEERG